MANKTASITANGSKGHHKFTLTVEETSTSKANNTSTISYSFKLSPITTGYDWANWTNASRTVSYTVNINGTAYTGTIPNYDGSSTVTLKSGTQTVTHNTDGTKTISFSFVVTDTTTVNYTSGNASANGTLALTAFEIEKPVTGTAPVITASVVDTNSTTIALTGNSSKLIKYFSDARATMSAEPQYGAAIAEDYLIIRNGSQTGYGYSHTFYGVESNVFNFSAEDDRGYVGTATVTASMVNYVRLTCNMANSRPDASGNMYLSCSGNYFNSSFGAQNNTLTVQYSYTGGGSSGSGYMTVSKSGNTYTAYANLSGLNYQATYSFVITATDKLETVTSRNSAVKSKPIFHWGENDFAFEVPVKFNSTERMTFKGDLQLKGDKNFGNTLYFGDIASTGKGYCYITEGEDNEDNIQDDRMTIKAKSLNLSLSEKLKINNAPVWGAWTPTLNYPSAVSSYEVQSGWYQKLGNVVTIGWQIKAYIKSGYHTKELMITEIPFYPSKAAFGGGVAYGVYVSTAGQSFECWCIEDKSNTDLNKRDKITARFQPCNNTSPGNLNVSSTCYYPKIDNETEKKIVTLSGTICYMTEV